MAKVTSALMGTTRGSVGNVTLRHTGGQTIASQKVTSVKNPRSYAQAEQRMRMAAATTFYSPLSDVLAKAWQGKTRTQSMGEFTRSAIASMSAGGYGFVKTWPTLRPYPYQVSKGSLPSTFFRINVADWGDFTDSKIDELETKIIPGVDYEVITKGQLYNAIIRYIGGVALRRLQITLIAINADTDASGVLVFSPVYGRILLSAGDGTLVRDNIPTGFSLGEFNPSNRLYFIPDSLSTAAMAVIISGYDGKKWVRSTEYMAVAPYWIDLLQASYQVGVESFMNSASVGTAYGDVYLDGEGTAQGREDASVTFDNLPLTSGGTANVVGFKWYDTNIADENVTIAAAVTDQGQTLPISGGSRMATYKKLLNRSTGNWYMPDETAFAALTCVVPDSDTASNFAFWQWVSQVSGISLYKVLYG